MSNKIRVAVIGYGSIGKRHADILRKLNCEVAVVSRRVLDLERVYFNVLDVVYDWQPSYVVIANETSLHKKTLVNLVEAGFTGKVLIEKPVVANLSEEIETKKFKKVVVAYNLRFHPVLRELKRILSNHEENPISVFVYAGSYLPDWRPDMDYRKSSSAQKERGGGVLRDLSHEIDYIQWFFGKCIQLTALGGKLSDLEIDAEDSFSVLMETEKCPQVTFNINYIDHKAKRNMIIIFKNETIEVDLIANEIKIGDRIKSFKVERNDSYILQHRSILYDEDDSFCTISEGFETLKTIENTEKAAREKIWIIN